MGSTFIILFRQNTFPRKRVTRPQTLNPEGLASELFADWLRDLPIAAESVRVEPIYRSL
jgi:hypothetical protein